MGFPIEEVKRITRIVWRPGGKKQKDAIIRPIYYARSANIT